MNLARRGGGDGARRPNHLGGVGGIVGPEGLEVSGVGPEGLEVSGVDQRGGVDVCGRGLALGLAFGVILSTYLSRNPYASSSFRYFDFSSNRKIVNRDVVSDKFFQRTSSILIRMILP